MIHELDSHPGDELAGYDVCVVGSGPAGATLAAELAGSGLRLVLLESGRRRPTRLGDRLRRVASEGIAIKDYSRERVLGGTSTTWAGLSSPLDAIDFVPRGRSHQGWPLSRDELLGFYAQASERYRFAPLAAFGPAGFRAVKARGDLSLAWQDLDEKVFLAASEPQDFGRELSAVLEGPDVDVFLDATLMRLEGGSASAGGPGAAVGQRVARGLVRTSSGRSVTVKASVFVLATGGLENARLLLLSTDLCAAGLGNEHDQVGRYLMNHPKNDYGTIRLAAPVRELPYHFGCLSQGYAGYAGLRLSEARQREQDALNGYVRLEPVFPWSGNRGVEAFVLMVKRSRLLLRFWKDRRQGKLVSLRDYSETGDDSDLQNERKTAARWLSLVGLVLVNLVPVARYVAARLRDGRSPPVTTVRLRNFMEMEPDPDNRVTLGAQRDEYGQPLTVVRHQTTARDRRSLVALHATLAAELRRAGFGELDSELASATPWPIDLDASHHMGTTRMGRDPASSVVDPDGRLHGVENVYLAGASVFPTSGCANPTYTLVALSIRLAAHLRRCLGAPPRAPAARAGGTASPESAGAVAAQASSQQSPEGSAAAQRMSREQPATGLADARRRPSESSSGPPRRVLVVGAGRRVVSDVLPALAALPGSYAVEQVVARRERVLSAGGVEYPVAALDALDADVLARCDLVYLAVSKGAVPAVLARLLRHDVSKLDLLIDTPVLLLRHAGHATKLAAFRNAWVAEDCTTLPWLGLVRAAASSGLLGTPRSVVLDRSAWRYHGLALIKTLLGSARIVSARRRTVAADEVHLDVRLANGGEGRIVEPRDYARGSFVITGTAGTLTDDPQRQGAGLLLEPVVVAGRCTGLRCGDLLAELDAPESDLLGPMEPGERLSVRTEDWKRVGLRRLLQDVAAGRGAYPLVEGLDDMVVDALLDKLGRYRATALTSIKAPLGRGLASLLTRLAGR